MGYIIVKVPLLNQNRLYGKGIRKYLNLTILTLFLYFFKDRLIFWLKFGTYILLKYKAMTSRYCEFWFSFSLTHETCFKTICISCKPYYLFYFSGMDFQICAILLHSLVGLVFSWWVQDYLGIMESWDCLIHSQWNPFYG